MNRTSGKSDRPMATPEDRKKYIDAWTTMMVDIWREKIERLQVWDTWSLHHSVMEDSVSSQGASYDYVRIMHSFAEYGIYQDMGVGKGFSHGNRGDLGFTPVRQPRPWFSRAYFASYMVLKEQMSWMYGEEFCGMISDAINNAEYHRSTTLRSNAWGHHSRR